MENTLPTTQDILEAINAFSDRVDQRFEAVDRRFEAVDQRFESIDRRFDAMDRRFEGIDQRLEGMVTKAEFSSAMETITAAIDHNDRKANILIKELVLAESLSPVAANRVLQI